MNFMSLLLIKNLYQFEPRIFCCIVQHFTFDTVQNIAR